jgi:peptidyl-prolyl cis-trans isomerase B (cyclophilin B)
MHRFASINLFAAMIFVAGCSAEEPAPAPQNPPQEKSAASETPMKPKLDIASGKYDPFKAPANGEEVAVLETGEGRIVLRFFEDAAPNHVKNFKDLVQKGFYDGTKFHRTIPGFMIQGGDPNTKNGDPATWGQGGPDSNVMAEFSDIPHKRGILSMARTDDPNSAGSQFFVVVKDSNFLDNNYTAFGAVVDEASMKTADKIVQTPTLDSNGTVNPSKAVVLKKARIAKWPVK